MAVFGGSGPTATSVIWRNSPAAPPLQSNQSGQSPGAFVAQPIAFNPASSLSSVHYSNTNLTITGTQFVGQNAATRATKPQATSKVRFELTVGATGAGGWDSSNPMTVGIDTGASDFANGYPIPGSFGNTFSLTMSFWPAGWSLTTGGTGTASGTDTFAVGDIIGFELDSSGASTTLKITHIVSGTETTLSTITGLGAATFSVWAGQYQDNSSTGNFSGPFSGTATSGFTAYDGTPVPAAAAVTGTAAITDAADTVSASGSSTVDGSSAVTDAIDTVSATGAVAVAGTLAVTDALDTLAATGADTVSGTFARTDAADTTAGTASSTITGTIAATDTKDTTSSTGALTVTGTAAATDALDTLTASGTVGSSAITGTASLADAADTLSAVGSPTITGSAVLSGALDSISASGAPSVSGIISLADAPDTVSGTALVITFGRMKVRLGTAFVVKPVRVWDGANWNAKPLKVWSGSGWIV